MQDLKEWAIQYFRSRDAFTKSIVSIDDESTGVIITHKTKLEKIAVLPHLNSATPETINVSACIITLNNSENINTLSDRWKEFKTRDMKIFFVTLPHKKWVINPLAHARVCDDASLKRGLHALAEELP